MKRKLLSLVALTSITSASLFFVVSPVDAVATRHFTLDNAASLSAGELDGTMVHSQGHITVGVSVARTELEGATLAYSVVRADDGTIYVGTGDAGQIFRIRGGDVSLFAETGQLMVSSLAISGGTLYAGTLPEGRIFKIARNDGAIEELARPEGAEHVWDLVHHDGRLYAATGPEGKVFAIDAQGRSQEYFDADDTHVLSLALDGDVIYAGTSDDSLVYRLRGPGQAEVVYDFPGTEVTAIAARDGMLAVVANEMPAPRTTSSKTKATSRRNGKGRLWRVDTDGRTERLHHRDAGHFTSVAIDANGTIYVGGGKDGQIFRVGTDRNVATWADVDERQVLDIDASGDQPVFVTGDSAAVYRTSQATPQQAIWTSKALDASYQARWGQLTWRGEGRVEFQTRSGNTEEPDDTWTDWSAAARTPGPVRSPSSRFIQVRARLTNDAVVRAVQVYYLPQNQRTVINSIGLKTKASKVRDALPSPSSSYELVWKVSNPDEDALRYRLRYRQEDQQRWRAMFREDVQHTKAAYTWDTSGLPDGWYVIEVEASDELANPEALTLRTTRQSEPVLIDNHPPRLENVAYRNGRIIGRAVDTLGPIARLEVAIDGDAWRPILSSDQLLDTADERFEAQLPPLEAGEHIIAVKATDAGGNWASTEVRAAVR